MSVDRKPGSRWNRLWIIVAAGALLFGALPAEAQLGGGGMGRGGRRGGKKKPTRQPIEKPKEIPGSVQGIIQSFKPASERALERDPDLIGTLRIIPMDKSKKTLSLKIRRPEEVDEEMQTGEGLVIQVGGHKFEDVEDYSEIFMKGLYVTAGWVFEDPESKKRIKPKELRTLNFDTILVEGKIAEIEDGQIVLKRARPKDGRPWPRRPSKPDQGNSKKKENKKIPARKVKLRPFEDMSKYKAGQDELDLDDFEIGQMVEVRVVFSTKVSMLVEMMTPDEKEEADQPEKPGRRGRPGRRGARPGGRG